MRIRLMLLPDMTARYQSHLPIEVLHQHLVYDSATGTLLRRKKTGLIEPSAWLAKPVGEGTRYRTITVMRNTYMAHVVAWAMFNGRWPVGQIDHIDGNRANNAICNLREVTASENMQNRRRAHSSNTSSGLLGVALHRSGRWQARITVGKKNLCLGTFDCPKEAHAAYLDAKRRLHPGCTI